MFALPVLPGVELRPLRPSDSAGLVHAVRTNREWLAPWLPHWLPLIEHDAAHAWCRSKAREQADETAMVAVIVSVAHASPPQPFDGPEMVGGGRWIGCLRTEKLDRVNAKTQLEFWLDRTFAGHGIMTACMRAFLRYGFEVEGWHRATVRCAVGHPRVRRLVERLGFVHEGRIRETIRRGETWVDDDLFGLLAHEFRDVDRPST